MAAAYCADVCYLWAETERRQSPGDRDCQLSSNTFSWYQLGMYVLYTRLQTVWSLPGHSRHANKGHGPRCHRRPNGPSRLADKVVQPTTQYAEGCTYIPIANVFGVHMRVCIWGRVVS